jgi:hypothetical protein
MDPQKRVSSLRRVKNIQDYLLLGRFGGSFPCVTYRLHVQRAERCAALAAFSCDETEQTSANTS